MTFLMCRKLSFATCVAFMTCILSYWHLHICAFILLLYTTDFFYLYTMVLFMAFACFLSLAYFRVSRIGNNILIQFMVVPCIVIRNAYELFLLLMPPYEFFITCPCIFITFQPVRIISTSSVAGALYCLIYLAVFV